VGLDKIDDGWREWETFDPTKQKFVKYIPRPENEVQVMIRETKDRGYIWEIEKEEVEFMQAQIISSLRRKGLRAKQIRAKTGISERTQSRRYVLIRDEMKRLEAIAKSRSAKIEEKS